MNAKELFQVGQLGEAVAAAGEDVKRHPADLPKRALLCDLLCFSGEFERADKQLDAMGHQDPQAMLVISLVRQLIRAEQARREFYQQGRVPELLDQPAGHLKLRLEASVRLRDGQPAEAAALLQQAEQQRPQCSGRCDDEPFGELRDLDDLTASFFEVLTSTGKYYWIPIERVELIEFHPPEVPRDLLWRRVHMVVSGGPDGEVFLPALYADSHTESDDRLRLGRMTDWRGGDGAPVRGIGQRMFLIGQKDRSIMELQQLTFSSPTSPEEGAESC